MRQFAVTLAAALFAGAAAAAPETVRLGETIEGALTASDSPRDGGGVSRDYRVQASSSQFLIVSVRSEDFDGTVTVFNPDRSKAAENDDRADGNLNPLAVVETEQDGIYIIRVGSLSSGDESLGKFQMKVVTFSE